VIVIKVKVISFLPKHLALYFVPTLLYLMPQFPCSLDYFNLFVFFLFSIRFLLFIQLFYRCFPVPFIVFLFFPRFISPNLVAPKVFQVLCCFLAQ